MAEKNPPSRPAKPATPESSGDLATDLTIALKDWKPPSAEAAEKLKAALEGLVEIPLDLNDMADEELMEIDTISQNRRLYVGSLLRLYHYLARRPDNIQEEENQARLSLGYIKHIEGSKALKLHLGRTAADGKLAQDVSDLRNEMANLVKHKQKLDDKTVIDAE